MGIPRKTENAFPGKGSPTPAKSLSRCGEGPPLKTSVLLKAEPEHLSRPADKAQKWGHPRRMAPNILFLPVRRDHLSTRRPVSRICRHHPRAFSPPRRDAGRQWAEGIPATEDNRMSAGCAGLQGQAGNRRPSPSYNGRQIPNPTEPGLPRPSWNPI